MGIKEGLKNFFSAPKSESEVDLAKRDTLRAGLQLAAVATTAGGLNGLFANEAEAKNKHGTNIRIRFKSGQEETVKKIIEKDPDAFHNALNRTKRRKGESFKGYINRAILRTKYGEHIKSISISENVRGSKPPAAKNDLEISIRGAVYNGKSIRGWVRSTHGDCYEGKPVVNGREVSPKSLGFTKC